MTKLSLSNKIFADSRFSEHTTEYKCLISRIIKQLDKNPNTPSQIYKVLFDIARDSDCEEEFAQTIQNMKNDNIQIWHDGLKVDLTTNHTDWLQYFMEYIKKHSNATELKKYPPLPLHESYCHTQKSVDLGNTPKPGTHFSPLTKLRSITIAIFNSYSPYNHKEALKRKDKNPNAICELCWRGTLSQSHYYCFEHTKKYRTALRINGYRDKFDTPSIDTCKKMKDKFLLKLSQKKEYINLNASFRNVPASSIMNLIRCNRFLARRYIEEELEFKLSPSDTISSMCINLIELIDTPKGYINLQYYRNTPSGARRLPTQEEFDSELKKNRPDIIKSNNETIQHYVKNITMAHSSVNTHHNFSLLRKLLIRIDRLDAWLETQRE